MGEGEGERERETPLFRLWPEIQFTTVGLRATSNKAGAKPLLPIS